MGKLSIYLKRTKKVFFSMEPNIGYMYNELVEKTKYTDKQIRSVYGLLKRWGVAETHVQYIDGKSVGKRLFRISDEEIEKRFKEGSIHKNFFKIRD